MHRELDNIFITDMPSGKLSQNDHDYLTRIVAKRSGLGTDDAGHWVDEVYASLWMFIAFLLSAFVASLSATFGGAQRDKVPVHAHN